MTLLTQMMAAERQRELAEAARAHRRRAPSRLARRMRRAAAAVAPARCADLSPRPLRP